MLDLHKCQRHRTGDHVAIFDGRPLALIKHIQIHVRTRLNLNHFGLAALHHRHVRTVCMELLRDVVSARSGPENEEIPVRPFAAALEPARSEEHTSELQSLMRISYAVFCLKKKHNTQLKQTKQKEKKRQRTH